MLALKDRLVDVPIMSLQTGSEVARTEGPIIDPRQLIVPAFYCEGPMLDINPAILHTSDIREVSNIGFIVDSSDDLMSPDDLVRLQEVLAFKFELDGKQVIEDTGRKVGKVVNYAVDTDSFYIIKLHVKPGMLHAWQTAELIIDRTQVREVTDTHIVVKSAVIKDEEPAKADLKPVVENPFRRPQAEASRLDET
ncbi:MAG: hypothetical protein ACREGJ_03490 [Candidatus Saccharimonadales bacterium]